METTFQLLIKDHKKVQTLINELLSTSMNAKSQRKKLLGNLKEELQLHEKIEEEEVYPVLEKKKNLKDITLEAYQEHHIVDVLLDELESLDFKDENWKAKLTVLQENLQHHIEEEEKEIFPEAEKTLTMKELNLMEANIKQQKSKVTES